MARIMDGVAAAVRRLWAMQELHRTLEAMDDHMRSDVGLPPRGVRFTPNWRLIP